MENWRQRHSRHYTAAANWKAQQCHCATCEIGLGFGYLWAASQAFITGRQLPQLYAVVNCGDIPLFVPDLALPNK